MIDHLVPQLQLQTASRFKTQPIITDASLSPAGPQLVVTEVTGRKFDDQCLLARQATGEPGLARRDIATGRRCRRGATDSAHWNLCLR